MSCPPCLSRPVAAGALALTLVGVAPGPAQAGVRRPLPTEVVAMAADGTRAVVLLGSSERGNARVRLFDVASGRSTDIRPPADGGRFFRADAVLPAVGGAIAPVALAHRRVLWRSFLPGNNTYDAVWSAREDDVRPRRLTDWAARDNDRGVGTHRAGLVGDGSTAADGAFRLALRTPDACTGEPTDPPGACELTPVGGLVRQLLPGGVRRLDAGPRSLHALAADRRRLAGLRLGGVVAVLPTAGGPALEVDPAPDEPVGVGLDRDDLVVLTRSARLLHVGTDGKLRRAFRLPAGAVERAPGTPAARVDVHAGVAVYVVGRVAYGLRLAGGTRRALVRFPTVPVGVELEEGGLSYAWNVRTRRAGRRVPVGRLGWMSPAEVERRLGP